MVAVFVGASLADDAPAHAGQGRETHPELNLIARAANPIWCDAGTVQIHGRAGRILSHLLRANAGCAGLCGEHFEVV